jgi:micrococcal nuclease
VGHPRHPGRSLAGGSRRRAGSRDETRLTAYGTWLALLLGVVWLCACGAPLPPPTPGDGSPAVITEVIDGDTVRLADGRLVRYLGINTPERGQPFYREATEANRRLVEGRTVWLVLDVQTTDRYGRVLAYVWVGPQSINLELVRQGYANAYTSPPNLRYHQEILQAEREARQRGLGLWRPSSSPIRIIDIQYDAPGPDHLNPNGEWVEIQNQGANRATLAGFTLKDQANHVYTFPDVSLEPGQVLRVYSGQGTDQSNALFWGLVGDAVWNNDGDIAYLRDPQGLLVDSYEY